MRLADGTKVAKSFHPSFYSNLTLTFDNLIAKGFSVQCGCQNIFDEGVFFIQPYDGNHAPLPGKSREFQLKLSYNFSFAKNK
jgi:hypothetical protein